MVRLPNRFVVPLFRVSAMAGLEPLEPTLPRERENSVIHQDKRVEGDLSQVCGGPGQFWVLIKQRGSIDRPNQAKNIRSVAEGRCILDGMWGPAAYEGSGSQAKKRAASSGPLALD